MSMGANGILAYPPSVYFPNIGFNNDFYSIPNNGTGITLNYANTHYLFSTGNASSSAITTFFSGSIGIGSPPSGISGDLIALTISANNISASNIQENGVNLSSKYYTISNALILSNTLTSNINLKESILTFSAPLTRSVNTIGIDLSSYLTSATAASTYYTIANATTLSNTLTSNINLKQNTLTTSTVLSGIGSNITLINYNTLSNLPNLSVYALNSSLSSYQPLLTTSTTLTGVGSNITLINYNTLSNLPNLSVYALNSSLASYQPLLTTSTVLNGIGSNITLINYNTLSNLPNLAQYLTITSASSTYLPLSGGTMTGAVTYTTSSGNNPIYITSTSTTANNCIQIKNNSTYTSYIGMGGTAFGGNYANNLFLEASSSSIIFNTNGRTSASIPNMIVHSSGNIGIGTTNPAYNLDVNGNINTVGNLTINGKITISNTNTNNLNFDNNLNDYKINLWGGVYGFGIRGNTLVF